MKSLIIIVYSSCYEYANVLEKKTYSSKRHRDINKLMGLYEDQTLFLFGNIIHAWLTVSLITFLIHLVFQNDTDIPVF